MFALVIITPHDHQIVRMVNAAVRIGDDMIDMIWNADDIR